MQNEKPRLKTPIFIVDGVHAEETQQQVAQVLPHIGVEGIELTDVVDLPKDRAGLGVRPPDRRFTEEVLDVVDDRAGLEDVAPVVHLEHGEDTEGMAGEVFGLFLLALGEVDDDLLDLDLDTERALLGEIETDLRGVRGDGKEEEFQGEPRAGAPGSSSTR